MKLHKEYDLLNDKKTIILVNVLAGISLFLFFPFFSWIAVRLLETAEGITSFNLMDIFVLLLIYFVLIVVHELIHGLFFKVFDMKGKVKFGFKNGMAYATSPHSFYPKGKFIWIVLSPFTLITMGLFFLAYIQMISPVYFIGLATIHAASCCGDFYWVYLILKAPKGTYVEDTENGISFYFKE